MVRAGVAPSFVEPLRVRFSRAPKSIASTNEDARALSIVAVASDALWCCELLTNKQRDARSIRPIDAMQFSRPDSIQSSMIT